MSTSLTAFDGSVENVRARALADGDEYVVIWHKGDLQFVSTYATFDELSCDTRKFKRMGYTKKMVYCVAYN